MTLLQALVPGHSLICTVYRNSSEFTELMASNAESFTLLSDQSQDRKKQITWLQLNKQEIEITQVPQKNSYYQSQCFR